MPNPAIILFAIAYTLSLPALFAWRLLRRLAASVLQHLPGGAARGGGTDTTATPGAAHGH